MVDDQPAGAGAGEEATPSDGGAPTPGASRGRRRRRYLLSAAAVLAVAGIVLLVVALLGQRSAPEPVVASGPPPAPIVINGPANLPVPSGQILPASVPTSIAIPSIGVRSVVNQVGLNPDGSLEVPAPGPLYDQAAWYRASPQPGTIGPSVIIGHIDSKANGPSVFFELARLKTGDTVSVARADGTTATFQVDSVRSFAKDDFPSLSVFGNTSRAELRLITCGGSFDEAARSYRDNTVVFAHLIGSVRS